MNPLQIAQTAIPNPEEFSTLFSRIVSGDSSALDLRNNLQLCGNAESGFTIHNRNGSWCHVETETATNAARLYILSVTLLCAEFSGISYHGTAPEHDFLNGWN